MINPLEAGILAMLFCVLKVLIQIRDILEKEKKWTSTT